MKTLLLAFLAAVAVVALAFGVCLLWIHIETWRNVRRLKRDLARLRASVDRGEADPDG